jgi:Fe-S oxidoreductase
VANLVADWAEQEASRVERIALLQSRGRVAGGAYGNGHSWTGSLICCGSAGIYNLVKPEPAAELGERKARNLLGTGAEAVVAANPGCALQISAHTKRLGRPLPVLHPMELLARSLA